MENKSVIEKLSRYFMHQDRDVVCKMLASCMLDLHRFMNLETLSNSEMENLFDRMKHNMKEMESFLHKEDTSNEKLTLEARNSE